MTAARHRDFNDLSLSVAGIIFLGAPFQGSDVAIFAKWLARLSGLDSTMLKLLERGSPRLHEVSREFGGKYSNIDIVCFYENREADYGLFKAQVCLYSFLQGSPLITCV